MGRAVSRITPATGAPAGPGNPATGQDARASGRPPPSYSRPQALTKERVNWLLAGAKPVPIATALRTGAKISPGRSCDPANSSTQQTATTDRIRLLSPHPYPPPPPLNHIGFITQWLQRPCTVRGNLRHLQGVPKSKKNHRRSRADESPRTAERRVRVNEHAAPLRPPRAGSLALGGCVV